MGLFSGKDKTPTYTPEPPPSVSTADLADAVALMDRWDRAMGDSNAMWSCLDAIAHRGGFRGAEATLMAVMDGRPSSDVVNRPWRWWTEAGRMALTNGDNILPSKIFLFAYLFTHQMVPSMNAATQVDLGLGRPDDDSYRMMAHHAILAMVNLPPAMLIHDTRTGKVDIAAALKLAHSVTGTTPPATQAPPVPSPTSATEMDTWNSY